MRPRHLFAGLSALAAAFAAGQSLQPFTLPWNDGSDSPASLRSWNGGAIPADAPRIVVDPASGHLTQGPDGPRVRFLGVNITADTAFPDASAAPGIAARLAKFGINSVRFHHLEAPWAPTQVLVDYLVSNGQAVGRSRQLDPVALDRLQRFIAALAAEGITTNLNLLVSRQFFPDDGLPAEISQLTWKEQQTLGFFDDRLIDLQREYATQLLTAPNPHRGRPFATDPAVAIVEILNEHGLVHAWHGRELDDLPAAFHALLQGRWNAFLQDRYPAGSSALFAAWGARDEPLGANRLVNGSFAGGTTGWNTERHGTAAATFSARSDFTGGQPSLRIAVTTPSSESWHVQLNQGGHNFTAGSLHTVSFWARASSAVPLSVSLGRTGPSDYSTVVQLVSTTLGTSWQQYTATFVASTAEPSIRLNFNGFAGYAVNVDLADVRWQPGGKAGLPPDGTSLEAGNLPTVLKTPPAGAAATAGQHDDWIRFLLTLEDRYWSTLASHVRSLGYDGILVGTIGANSPATVQARHFDALDSHFYWHHPQFPAGDWDPVNWTVAASSMVNDPSSGPNRLALQRVAGKPHFVTEYQHSSPNPHSAEGPLFLAAYAALQDWDGLWFFDYGSGRTSWDRAFISGFFAQDTHPAKMANMIPAAALFRRGDASPSSGVSIVAMDPATDFDVIAHRGGHWSVGDLSHIGVNSRSALIRRVAMDSALAGPPILPPTPSGPVFASETGQIRWDTSRSGRGIFTADTPRTKLLTGFPDGRTFDLGGVVFEPGSLRLNWLTATVSLVEGDAFSGPAASRAVIVATGEVENTGQVWNDASKTSVGTNWGRAPVLVETVPLTLTLPVPAGRVSAWALGETGQRTQALAVGTSPEGNARLQLGSSGTTLWYEIVIAADPSASAPRFTRNLFGTCVPPGSPAKLSVAVEGTPPLQFAWTRNGQPAPGNGATLTFASTSTADDGLYQVTVTNALGTAASRAARLAVLDDAAPHGELSNLSTRGFAGNGGQALIAGLVTAGNDGLPLVLRGVGPALAQQGVPSPLPAPHLELTRLGPGGWSTLGTATAWDTPGMADAFTRVGAFPLPAGSPDAAIHTTVGAGVQTIVITPATGANGEALAEVYRDGPAGGSARLSNLSSRGWLPDADTRLIAGLVIDGPAPVRVLLRGLGPSLAAAAVETPLPDPLLELYSGGPGTPVLLAMADNWEQETDAAALNAAASAVGAPTLSAGSPESALLLWLDPGPYTLHLRDTASRSGTGLVEVFEVR